MTEKAKHTATPWQQGRFVDGPKYRHMSESWKAQRRQEERDTIRGPGVVGTPGCNVVCRVVNIYDDDKAFLLRAVNAHETLIAVLEAAIHIYDELSLSSLALTAKFGPDYEPPSVEELIELRRAIAGAIALAKKEATE